MGKGKRKKGKEWWKREERLLVRRRTREYRDGITVGNPLPLQRAKQVEEDSLGEESLLPCEACGNHSELEPLYDLYYLCPRCYANHEGYRYDRGALRVDSNPLGQ